MTQLCTVLGVDPQAVSWDTETLDGDVRSVVGDIETARFGENRQDQQAEAGASDNESLARVSSYARDMQHCDDAEMYQDGQTILDMIRLAAPEALLSRPTDAEVRFGNRRVPKMYAQTNELRQAVAAEGSPCVQAAWGKVEEHIDFVYQQAAGAGDQQPA